MYAFDRLVADSHRSRRGDIYGSAQPPYPELAGASFHARGNCRLRLASRLERDRAKPCGLALGALLFGVLCWLGGMGMGDVKLCAAIGAWIGPAQLLFALVITGMAGGIMALCWAAAGGFLGELFQGAGDLVFGFTKRGLASSSRVGSKQSIDAQDAVCSGHRDRNDRFLLFSLRTERNTMVTTHKNMAISVQPDRNVARTRESRYRDVYLCTRSRHARHSRNVCCA